MASQEEGSTVVAAMKWQKALMEWHYPSVVWKCGTAIPKGIRMVRFFCMSEEQSLSVSPTNGSHVMSISLSEGSTRGIVEHCLLTDIWQEGWNSEICYSIDRAQF